MRTLKSYLCGTWQTGDGAGTVLENPTTGQPIAQASTRGLDLAAAVRYAREVGGPNLRRMTFRERGEMLKALSKALYEVREELIATSLENVGSPRGDAKFDIDGATGTLAAYALFAKSLPDRPFLVEGDGEPLTRSPRFCGYHIKSARRGVAVHINAFNFPAWGLAEKAAVAWLAGMPIITKPATSTALLASHVVEKMIETGVLPEGALQYVCGSAGDLLDHLSGQDCLAFTGGSETAKLLRAHPAVVAHNVRMNVEADSLNAAVLGPDASPESDLYGLFIRHVSLEMTQKAGQKCTAVRRVLVPEQHVDAVVTDLSAALRELRVGAPGDVDVKVGPLASRGQKEDAIRGVSELLASGARIVFGEAPSGSSPGAPTDGYFVAPVLLCADGNADAAAVHEREVFAPVATVLPYHDVAGAIDLVARGGGSLVASVYSDDRAVVEELALGIAPYSGRVVVGGSKVAEQMITPGMVLPASIHGGPGRAGGGEELGGLRGLDFYMQRTALQGDRSVLDRVLGLRDSEKPA